MNQNICVFCSSAERIDKIYFEVATELGIQIAQHKDRLVYGGAKVGLMGRIAQTVKENEGFITGIIPQKIHDFDLGWQQVDEYIITKDMRERKKQLIERADAFVVLPGGFGTLEELLEVLTLKQLGYHSKAVVLINENGIFDGLLNYFETLFSEHFAKEAYRELYFIAANVTEAYDYIKKYQSHSVVTKWD